MAVVRKTERIALVATKAQVAAWKLAADQRGVSLSELLRQAASQSVRDLTLGQHREHAR